MAILSKEIGRLDEVEVIQIIDFDHEFSQSHKLLKLYEDSDNLEGMKYELSKLWFLNNLLEKNIYSESDKIKKDGYHKSRARILNDFHKYSKIGRLDEGEVIQIIDFDHKFSQSHKLLKIYEESENLEGMKYELSKLWFLNNLLEKQIYSESDEDKKKEYHKSRARILNVFHKYSKLVNSKDKEFNFTTYYNNSPFNDVNSNNRF